MSLGFFANSLFAVLRRRNLNNVIDINYYPVEQARRSNFRHRPIGIGVQGFADLLMRLRLPFESKGAIQLNRCGSCPSPPSAALFCFWQFISFSLLLLCLCACLHFIIRIGFLQY